MMYYTNFISSPKGYFHTVICNNEEFCHTVISHDFHYIEWYNPLKQHLVSLTMTKWFGSSQDKIDKGLLGRTHRFSPRAWCVGNSEGGRDPCCFHGNDSMFRPSPGAERVRQLFQTLLSEEFKRKQCS